MKLPIPALRRRLALWYTGMFAAALLGLGLLMYLRLTHATERELVDGLAAMSDEALVVMKLHTEEGTDLDRAAALTMAEMDRGDRMVYVVRTNGDALGADPATTLDPRVAGVARSIGRAGGGEVMFRGEAGQAWHAFGRPGVLAGDTVLFLALADRARTEATERRILETFLLAGLLSVGAIVGIGMVLIRISLRPVEEVFDYRERFLADVAHELRAPLAVLHTLLDGAERRGRDAESDGRVSEGVKHEVARMTRMVEGLLLLARAEAGVRPVQRAACYLDDVVSDAVGAAAAMAAKSKVDLELASYEEAPVTGDPDLLFQLARALIDNAIKFTPEGGRVWVSVGTRDGAAELTVDDTGPGIDPVDLPRIFDRFYRSPSARAGAAGSGLGLAIVRWIADEHDGTVAAANRPEGGARFSFRMRARQTPAGAGSRSGRAAPSDPGS